MIYLLSSTALLCICNLILTMIQCHRLKSGFYGTINKYQQYNLLKSLYNGCQQHCSVMLSPHIAQNGERGAFSLSPTSLPFCHTSFWSSGTWQIPPILIYWWQWPFMVDQWSGGIMMNRGRGAQKKREQDLLKQGILRKIGRDVHWK